jgi:hypothetical protein
VAPDLGGVKLAEAYARVLDRPVAVVRKLPVRALLITDSISLTSGAAPPASVMPSRQVCSIAPPPRRDVTRGAGTTHLVGRWSASVSDANSMTRRESTTFECDC